MGAGFEQGSSTFVDRCACGEHVVDEQNALADDLLGSPEGECLTKVLKASRTREGDLRIRIEDTNEVPIGYRPVQDRTDTIGEKQRLIELSAAEAIGMERDRHQDVCLQGVGDGPGKQRSQRIGQSHLPLILEQGDGVLQRRTIGIAGPDLGIVRLPGAAVMTFVSRAIGNGGGGCKGTVTSWAGRSMQRLNVLPAGSTEKRDRIIRERPAAGSAI